MAKQDTEQLSRRERQIMDVIYQQGRATVAEVVEAMEDAPSYSTVRTLMNILKTKGHLTHRKDGVRYIYSPTRPRRRAGKTALRKLVDTFYEGSVEQAVAALIEPGASNLTDQQLASLQQLIDRARTEGR